ncbi:DUF4391 domain-containing protein [Francisella philomiragia]|uniref:DUF4391 domain-containing protein n=1 Tax=Francisella philomiragia TaxID=28110 RepID=UPI001904B406|nr:DUF4391 domain-containing protein [Francisella philomiragia]MBK2296732.1 DUF4391 domain-containing protein [Francisella philomiragia]MBK2341469.1 DUF4391 domain-containing protein [Francisella philomiragia]
MAIENIIENLNIPTSRISKRIPKNSFETNTKLTTAEKKYLANDVKLITLEYSLVQQNIQVPAILDDEYNYSAINIISVQLNSVRNFKKIASVINKSIPTANLLVFYLDDEQIPVYLLHTQTKRINQADKSKMVLLEEYDSGWINFNSANEIENDFVDAIRYENLIKYDLKAMYQDIIDKMVALEIATKLGYFSLDDIAEKKEILRQITELTKQNNSLKKEHKKAINFSDKANINMQIQANRKSIEDWENKLKEFDS